MTPKNNNVNYLLDTTLATRRALGRRFTLEENVLRRWDDFLRRHFGQSREVRPEMFHRWTKTMPHLPLCDGWSSG